MYVLIMTPFRGYHLLRDPSDPRSSGHPEDLLVMVLWGLVMSPGVGDIMDIIIHPLLYTP